MNPYLQYQKFKLESLNKHSKHKKLKRLMAALAIMRELSYQTKRMFFFSFFFFLINRGKLLGKKLDITASTRDCYGMQIKKGNHHTTMLDIVANST